MQKIMEWKLERDRERPIFFIIWGEIVGGVEIPFHVDADAFVFVSRRRV